MSDVLTIFRAKRIRTMNPGLPAAQDIAVRDGRIIEVGRLDAMRPWLDAFPHRIDDRFADKIFLPGFIDPHLHPSLCGTLLPMHFITALEWRLPWGNSDPVQGRVAYLKRLREIHESLPEGEPLLTWGYHRIWHGTMSRQALDQVAPDRPVLIWQRSSHEMYLNSAGIRWLEMDEGEIDRHHQIDAARGHFFELGKIYAIQKVAPYLIRPERFKLGLERMRQLVRLGGHTTVGNMGFGGFDIFDQDLEWQAICDVLDRPGTPFRVVMVGSARGSQDPEAEMDRVEAFRALNRGRLSFSDHVKMFADGGFFAELMQVMPPGFIDGHEGEWMAAPEQLEAMCRAAWMRGLKIHIHTTGDLGLELVLDILERLQWEKPRFDHRFTIEHFGMSNPEQCRKIARLGAQVSANPYYVHELGEAYWQKSIGHERASQIARLGTLSREGVTFALHSDLTMAPALPLNHAWVAVNRVAESGSVIGPDERIDVEAAMRAITIDAAYILWLENEVGSLRAGKKADITVLGADPFEVDSMMLKDLPVDGVIFEGEVF